MVWLFVLKVMRRSSLLESMFFQYMFIITKDINAGTLYTEECKIGTIYMLAVSNWPWKLVTINGLLLQRSVISSNLSNKMNCSFLLFGNTAKWFVLISVYLYELQLPIIWKYNKMSMLNLVASLVKVLYCFCISARFFKITNVFLEKHRIITVKYYQILPSKAVKPISMCTEIFKYVPIFEVFNSIGFC